MGRSTIEEKWEKLAAAAKAEAKKLPPGKDKDALLKKARQLETASQIGDWLSSPGLRCPE